MSSPKTGLTIDIPKTSMSENIDQFFSIGDIPASKLEMLDQKKIYFGHHSVGANIIEGIKDIIIDIPNFKINIVETVNDSDFQVGIFAHSRVGKNMDPKSKIDDFVGFINSGIGQSADIAGFKFCYADILLDTDIDILLDEYDQAVKELKDKYKDLKIIHFTSPLTWQRTTWKHLVKKIFRIEDPWRYGPNIKRNEYNSKLIQIYKDKDPIFDVAAIESTYPDGTRSTFVVGNNTYYSLVSEYTSDGGHLSEVGRKKIAEQFIIFLANLD